MMVLKRLWNDEAGFVVSTELVLLATVAVIGLLTACAALFVAGRGGQSCAPRRARTATSTARHLPSLASGTTPLASNDFAAQPQERL